jgi:polyhydroxyalkanoate synthesis regulator phasin
MADKQHTSEPAELDLYKVPTLLLGALHLAGDSFNKLIDELSRHGEQVSHDWEDQLWMTLRQFRLTGQAPDPNEPFWGYIPWLSEQLGVASRRDLHRLHIELARLDKTIAQIEE